MLYRLSYTRIALVIIDLPPAAVNSAGAAAPAAVVCIARASRVEVSCKGTDKGTDKPVSVPHSCVSGEEESMKKVSPVTGQAAYPGEGWLITSGFCTEAYFRQFGDWHTGHDLARSPQGGEPIYAIADGIVKWAENAGSNGFGNLVFIEHKTNLYSRYAHLATITVANRQQVNAGTVIGTLGSTGRVTGPHLHFDISRINNALDWPGKDKNRVQQNYIDPHAWYRDEATMVIEPPSGKRLRVMALRGLNVRARPSTSARSEYVIPYLAVVEVKDAAFLADSFTWRELVTGGWIAQEFTEPETPVEAVTPVGVRTETPTTITIPSPVVVAARGVHANAGGWAPTDQELDLVKHNQVKSVLIVAYEPNQAALAVSRFRDAGVSDFIVRAATHRPISPDPQAFVDDTLPRLREYRDALTSAFDSSAKLHIAVHNEPNVSVEGFGTAWRSGAEFTRWYMQVIRRYRDALPNITIGFPALSPGGDLALSGLSRMDEWRFLEQCAEAIENSDWVGVHAYFVGDGADIDLKPQRWRDAARGRSVIITEGGPADGIANNGVKLSNVYRRCEQAGLPVMAWLLSGAGAWQHAGWVEQNVRLPIS